MFNINEKKVLLNLFNIIVNDGDCNTSTMPLVSEGVVVVKDNEICHEISEENAKLLHQDKAIIPDKWSHTFHKTWEKVATEPLAKLVFEQWLHYVSTYGLESLGLQANPWIPAEKVFKDSDVKPSVESFVVIRMINPKEAIKLIEEYCRTTKSPKVEYTTIIISLMNQTTLSPDEIISNELKCARYKQLNLVPEDGQEFLRYIVYSSTGQTLLIKSDELVSKIKLSCTQHRDKPSMYFKLAKLDNLAKIFFRYKPIFLAFKADEQCRPYINKIRRLANNLHEPMSPYTIQNITNLMINGEVDSVKKLISNCNTRKLINLINFVSNKEEGPRTFTIRNGKGFVTDTQSSLLNADRFRLSEILCEELVSRVCDKLKNKIYYIPEYISYAVPTSEKQLVGNIPFGSSVSIVPEDGFCMAIHWDNFEKRRTDLDLHLCSDDGSNYGWNSGYRSQSRHILFSGDMTDATNGATEAFSFIPRSDEKYVLSVSNYTGGQHVPFKFLLTNKGFNIKLDNGYMSNPCCDVKDALFNPIPLCFNNSNDMTVGILNNLRFYFYSGRFGEGIVPCTDIYSKATTSLCNKLSSMLQLRTLLDCAGATIITTESELSELDEETRNNVIDLSPSSLTEQSIFEIVDRFDCV